MNLVQSFIVNSQGKIRGIFEVGVRNRQTQVLGIILLKLAQLITGRGLVTIKISMFVTTPPLPTNIAGFTIATKSFWYRLKNITSLFFTSLRMVRKEVQISVNDMLSKSNVPSFIIIYSGTFCNQNRYY